MDRRSFASILLATAGASTFDARWLGAQTPAPGPHFPRQDPEMVQEVVAQAHRSLDEVQRLVEAVPELAKASWDWGFGDWETALGAASHMGRRDIAEYLVSRGARPTLFSAAMLGQVDVVRAWVTASPGIQAQPGPHGITLMAHARAGGTAAEPVVAFLEEVGGADPAPMPEPGPSDVESLPGQYRFGPAPDDVLEVELRERGLALRTPGAPRRGLVDLGGGRFHPVGAPSVQVDLSRPDVLRLDYSGGRLEAVRGDAR